MYVGTWIGRPLPRPGTIDNWFWPLAPPMYPCFILSVRLLFSFSLLATSLFSLAPFYFYFIFYSLAYKYLCTCSAPGITLYIQYTMLCTGPRRITTVPTLCSYIPKELVLRNLPTWPYLHLPAPMITPTPI